jgi:hypothetical protein
MKPILLLEMNEIPWRVIDLYRGDDRFPHIRRFFPESRTYTTVAVDSGELSPWVTWPTIHRGLPNEAHGVYNLGQDPATFKGTPLWKEYRQQGLSIGVCGSLQSWPPQDPGLGGFYIPDTFAHDAQCIPSYIEPLQKFNLGQVQRNGRVVEARSFRVTEALRLMLSVPRLGLRLPTLWAIARQLWGERSDKALLARRSIFQTILFWDIFKSLYHPKHPPALATFFTNHVAGVMHRYWHHVFPEDFGGKYAGGSRVHKATMDFAMGYVDRMLGDVMRFQEQNPSLVVVFASSMGQDAVHRDEHEGFEASVPEISRLLSKLGMPRDNYRPLLAMVPQVAIDVPDSGHRTEAIKNLNVCRTRSGAPLFSVQEIGSSLSITIQTPSLADIRAGGFEGPDGVWHDWQGAGVAMNPVEPGTAYHIPEGSLAIRRVGVAGKDARTPISADAVKALLLETAGLVPAPAHPVA